MVVLVTLAELPLNVMVGAVPPLVLTKSRGLPEILMEVGLLAPVVPESVRLFRVNVPVRLLVVVIVVAPLKVFPDSKISELPPPLTGGVPPQLASPEVFHVSVVPFAVAVKL